MHHRARLNRTEQIHLVSRLYRETKRKIMKMLPCAYNMLILWNYAKKGSWISGVKACASVFASRIGGSVP